MGGAELLDVDSASVLILDNEPGLVRSRDIGKNVRSALADVETSASRIAISHKWIDACLDAQRLIDPAPYKVTLDHSELRLPGDTVDDPIEIDIRSVEDDDSCCPDEADSDFGDYEDVLVTPPRQLRSLAGTLTSDHSPQSDTTPNKTRSEVSNPHFSSARKQKADEASLSRQERQQ